MKIISLLSILFVSTNIAAVELFIEAELIEVASNNPQCGVLHIGSIAKYRNIKILSGNYKNNEIFVVHSCIELIKKEHLIPNKKYSLLLTTKKPNNINLFPPKTEKEHDNQLYFSKEIKILN